MGTEFFCGGEADFLGVEFFCQKGANFTFAKFAGEGGANFMSAKISGTESPSFFLAQFLGPGKIKFRRTEFEENKKIFFNFIEIGSTGILEFVDIPSLGNATFLYTDLEKVSFKNVRFRKTKNWFFNRENLADENLNNFIADERNKVEHHSDDYSQVEILYRQLKVNFENQRDYTRPGDFRYGEMEMQRKRKMLEWEEKQWVQKLGFLRFLRFFNLTQYYKIASGYGEKWQQALASFVAVLFFCAGLNLVWVEPKSVPQETTQIKKWESDFGHRLGGTGLFTFKVLTLQRWEHDFD